MLVPSLILTLWERARDISLISGLARVKGGPVFTKFEIISGIRSLGLFQLDFGKFEIARSRRIDADVGDPGLV